MTEQTNNRRNRKRRSQAEFDITDVNWREKFENAVEFCKKNVKYISAAGLFIVIVIVLVATTGKQKQEQPLDSTEAIVAETEATTETTENYSVVAENYAQDAYPEINDLIKKYYKAYANGKVKKLAKLATPVSDTEKSYISVFSEYVKSYKNISCYTKKGLEEGSYIVSVYLEIKFNDIETTAPGLDFFYVRTNEDGSLYIDNLYSQFNMSNQEQPLDAEVASMIEEFEQQEDVIKLQTEVQQKYEAAITSDEALKTMVETTIPDAITVWASDQAAAAKAAEEARIAEEEAAKKAAEEEAAKKAAEEKLAAERANAVVVYATDKVNVRAEASETAEVLGQLEIGAQTTRLEDKDGWSRIDYNNGTQGYVKSEFLSTEPVAPEAAAETGEAESTSTGGNSVAEGNVITVQESLNIRESMSQDSAKVATVFAGEKVTVIMSYAEGWTKVQYGDKTGYIKTDLLQ
ncbi:MAG: SH3 domain-containing protein [Lachnospiraceae bacterium]|nr:SH3 domain-containing protein [Lachnospiraceae bacterium]